MEIKEPKEQEIIEESIEEEPISEEPISEEPIEKEVVEPVEMPPVEKVLAEKPPQEFVSTMKQQHQKSEKDLNHAYFFLYSACFSLAGYLVILAFYAAKGVGVNLYNILVTIVMFMAVYAFYKRVKSERENADALQELYLELKQGE